MVAFTFAAGAGSLLFAACFVLATAHAQEPIATAQWVIDGGWFEVPVWRRAADGQLENHYFADAGGNVLGDAEGMRFQPLLGDGLQLALVRTGMPGMCTLMLHGRHDLVSMTGAEFHFAALGVPTGNVELRLSLATALPEGDANRRRAALLDRLLTIYLLERRGHLQAAPELRVLAREATEPMLRWRAAQAVWALTGKGEPPPRRRLDPEVVRLPSVIDACLVVDHARLPDLGEVSSWLRRRAALGIADRVRAAGRGRALSPAMCNGAQTHCDSFAELPFGAALEYGNARHDHSLVVFTASDTTEPFGLVWQAAGEYEHERWQGAKLPLRAEEHGLFALGSLQVEAQRVEARFAMRSAGEVNAEQARELLADSGAAIRSVVPAASRLWRWLETQGWPTAYGAELLVTFGDPAVIELRLEAGDEASAAAWRARGVERLQQLREWLREQLPEELLTRSDLAAVLDAAFGPEITIDGPRLTATMRVAGVTPAIARALVEALR